MHVLVDQYISDPIYMYLKVVFSLPEQRSWRAIVLPQASPLALALVVASASTNVKVLR